MQASPLHTLTSVAVVSTFTDSTTVADWGVGGAVSFSYLPLARSMPKHSLADPSETQNAAQEFEEEVVAETGSAAGEAPLGVEADRQDALCEGQER